jgi:hypothetical protein
VRDSHAVVLDSSHYFTASDAPASMPLVSLTRVLSRALGWSDEIGLDAPEAKQMMHEQTTETVKKTPKAHVIFNVESVGKSTSTHSPLRAVAAHSNARASREHHVLTGASYECVFLSHQPPSIVSN